MSQQLRSNQEPLCMEFAARSLVFALQKMKGHRLLALFSNSGHSDARVWCMITVSLGCPPPMTLETNDEVEKKITYLHIPSQLSEITAANDDQPILSLVSVYK